MIHFWCPWLQCNIKRYIDQCKKLHHVTLCYRLFDHRLINGSPYLSRAPTYDDLISRISFPGLELYQTTFAGALHSGMFSRQTLIAKGTRFGPYRGKQVNTSEIKSNDDNSFMWEVSITRTYLIAGGLQLL